jgi:hypothetical protein
MWILAVELLARNYKTAENPAVPPSSNLQIETNNLCEILQFPANTVILQLVPYIDRSAKLSNKSFSTGVPMYTVYSFKE